MAQLAVFITSTVMALNEGAQKRKQLRRQGDSLNEAANRRMAATTADMAEAKREKDYMASRAVAVASAQGAGLDDPTMVNVLGDLNAEGEYRIMANLYTGSSETEGIRYEAQEAYRSGEAALQSGYASAAKTLMSEYGNYGEMWGEAKDTYNKFKLKRQQKRIKSIIDPNMGVNSNVRYG